jgi:hypothetical protein
MVTYERAAESGAAAQIGGEVAIHQGCLGVVHPPGTFLVLALPSSAVWDEPSQTAIVHGVSLTVGQRSPTRGIGGGVTRGALLGLVVPPGCTMESSAEVFAVN